MSRKVSRLAVAISIVLFAAVALARAQAASHAAVEKQIVSMERALNDAFGKHDMAPFRANLAPEAMQIDGNGIAKVLTPEFEQSMKGVSVQSWTLDSSRFMWVDDNTVLHLYRWTGKGTFQGQPLPSPTWASTVWANKAGKWQAVFHQETNAMTPPPAAAKPSAPAPKK
jgi:hypothetical protein